MTMATQDRAALRTQLRARRKAFVAALPASVRALAFRVLPNSVLAQIAPGSCIALYRAMGSEVPTIALADYLTDMGFTLCLPRLCPTADDPHHMDFAEWTPDDVLVPGANRIPQPDCDAAPVVPDVVFTPLVGFDAALNRLGQGGGNYDRAFERLPDALRIGLAWSVQQVEQLPAEHWDMPLHMVITEARIYTPA